MARQFIITEEQYNRLMSESNEKIIIDASDKVKAKGGDVKSGVKDALSTTQQNGIPNDKTQVKIDGEAISEGRLLSKKKLQENRLKKLKKNSELYSVKDFMKKIK